MYTGSQTGGASNRAFQEAIVPFSEAGSRGVVWQMESPLYIEGICPFLYLMSHEMGALVAFDTIQAPIGSTELL